MKSLPSAARKAIAVAAFAGALFAAAMPAKPAASDAQRTVTAAPT